MVQEKRQRSRLFPPSCDQRKVMLKYQVWTLVKNKKELYDSLENFYRQRFDKNKIKFYICTLDSSITNDTTLPSGISLINLDVSISLQTALKTCLKQSKEKYIAYFDPKVCYGPFYLMDQYHALKYSQCKMVGKANYLTFDGNIFQNFKGLNNAILNSVECNLSSAVFDQSIPFELILKKDEWFIQEANLKWYSTTPHGLIKLNQINYPMGKIATVSNIEKWMD